MDPHDADAALDGAELVPAAEAALPDARRLLDRCLDAGIPARLGRDHHCGSGHCAPKAQLLVRAEDAPAVSDLLRRECIESAEREGTLDPEYLERIRAAPAGPDAEPPCPACGTAAPLVEGACSDCGLQLEEGPAAK